MAVLVVLAQNSPDVVTADTLLREVWQGQALGDNPVYKCISKLRKAFSNQNDNSVEIETIPKKGYRLKTAARFEAAPKPASFRSEKKNILSLKLLAAGVAVVAFAMLLITFYQAMQRPESLLAISDKSIVVLPFETLSNREADKLYASGLAEEIQHRLATNPKLKVIASLSSTKASFLDKSFGQIAELLRVNYILHGSIRHIYEGYKVNVKLVDRNGLLIWQQEFQVEQENVYSLQFSISQQVLDALEIPENESTQTANLSSNSSLAHQWYLIGQSIHQRRAPNWITEAYHAYQQAIETDPKHAGAYAGRGLMQLYSQLYQFKDVKVALPDIEMALQLAPNLADAHAVKGFYLIVSESEALNEQTNKGIKHLEKSIALNPNYIYAYTWLSNALTDIGQHDKALNVLEQAIEREPLDPVLNGNWANRQARKGMYKKAKEKYEQILSFPDTPAYIYEALISLNIEYGNFIDAFQNIEKFENRFGQQTLRSHLVNANFFARLEERALSVHSLNQARKQGDFYIADTLDAFNARLLLDDQVGMQNIVSNIQSDSDESNQSKIADRLLGITLFKEKKHAQVIKLFQPLYEHFDFSSVNFDGDLQKLDIILMLAYSYRAIGDYNNVSSILNEFDTYTERLKIATPKWLILKAQSACINGKAKESLELLDKAIQLGWRNIHSLKSDERWNCMRSMTDFTNLKQMINRSLDEQRRYLRKQYPEKFNGLTSPLFTAPQNK